MEVVSDDAILAISGEKQGALWSRGPDLRIRSQSSCCSPQCLPIYKIYKLVTVTRLVEREKKEGTGEKTRFLTNTEESHNKKTLFSSFKVLFALCDSSMCCSTYMLSFTRQFESAYCINGPYSYAKTNKFKGKMNGGDFCLSCAMWYDWLLVDGHRSPRDPNYPCQPGMPSHHHHQHRVRHNSKQGILFLTPFIFVSSLGHSFPACNKDGHNTACTKIIDWKWLVGPSVCYLLRKFDFVFDRI